MPYEYGEVSFHHDFLNLQRERELRLLPSTDLVLVPTESELMVLHPDPKAM